MKQSKESMFFMQIGLLWITFVIATILSLVLYGDFRKFSLVLFLTLIALFIATIASLLLYGKFKEKGTKEYTFDALFQPVELIALIYFFDFFCWASNNLGLLPVLDLFHGFGGFEQDLLGPVNIKVRLESIAGIYGAIFTIYGVIGWFFGKKMMPLLERGIFQVLAWIRRPWGEKASYNAMIKRLESLPGLPIPLRFPLFKWRREFNDILLGSPMPRLILFPSPVDLAVAGLVHFGVTAIFLPEILRGLFEVGWLGFIIGVIFIYFLIRWFIIFWSYFLILDTRKRALSGEKRKTLPKFAGVFAIFGLIYWLTSVFI